MSPVQMCDSATRVWCCRISLVFVISAVLLSMMFQIWSYYFSLVREMDQLSASNPQLGSIVSVCNGSLFNWNIECESLETFWNCTIPLSEKEVYLDSTCASNELTDLSFDECCRVMIWILPW